MKSIFVLVLSLVAFVQSQDAILSSDEAVQPLANLLSVANSPQPQKYRTNLITKGQKSVNDFGASGERIENKPEAAAEPIDYVLSPNCPQAFGLFAVQGSCRKYYHCRTGIAYESECAPNTVFEAAAETCVHPDQSSRSECAAPEFHRFVCPLFSAATTRLRFGDHDRLPHPSDCSKFYACLLNGQPRAATCPPPLAFEASSGFCVRYDRVKGCEHFYDHLVEVEAVPVVRQQVFEAVRQPVAAAAGSAKNFFNFGPKY
jgi:hypothetical protein